MATNRKSIQATKSSPASVLEESRRRVGFEFWKKNKTNIKKKKVEPLVLNHNGTEDNSSVGKRNDTVNNDNSNRDNPLNIVNGVNNNGFQFRGSPEINRSRSSRSHYSQFEEMSLGNFTVTNIVNDSSYIIGNDQSIPTPPLSSSPSSTWKDASRTENLNEGDNISTTSPTASSVTSTSTSTTSTSTTSTSIPTSVVTSKPKLKTTPSSSSMLDVLSLIILDMANYALTSLFHGCTNSMKKAQCDSDPMSELKEDILYTCGDNEYMNDCDEEITVRVGDSSTIYSHDMDDTIIDGTMVTIGTKDTKVTFDANTILEMSLNSNSNIAPMRLPATLCIGEERKVLFITEAMGIRLNRGQEDGIIRVLTVKPQSPTSKHKRRGEINSGDIIREIAGVDLRRPLTYTMWCKVLALMKIAPRPLAIIVANELSTRPPGVEKEFKKFLVGGKRLDPVVEVKEEN